MKVVIDTNVLISGIFFSGLPATIINAWKNGDLQFVLSPGIINEYVRVAKILSDEFPKNDINPILTMIVTHSEVVEAANFPVQVSEDPDDDKFLACALGSGSKIIISGDKHLLKLSGFKGIVVLTPRAFVEGYLKKSQGT